LVRPDLTSPEQKLYFVVETKGSIFADDRREIENLKITCGKKHFKAISEDINFQVANDFEYFSSKF
jgi:type III restriction enzyme